MNNFVFNSVAEELKANIYAQTPDSGLKSLQLDNKDQLRVGGAVTVENETITTIVSGSEFTSDSVIDLSITGTGSIFNNKDISKFKTATMFVYNRGTNTLTLSLQLSPTTNDNDYMDVPSFTDFTVEIGEKKIVYIGYFGHYTRLKYNMGEATGTITVYLNAQA